MSSQWSLCACLCDNRRLRERRLCESATAVAVCVSRQSVELVLCVNDPVC